jgi:hypothetical protein
LSNLETIEGEQATDKDLTATQACLSSSKDCKAKSKTVPLKIVVKKPTPLQKKVHRKIIPNAKKSGKSLSGVENEIKCASK